MQDQRETIQSTKVWLEGLCHDSPIHFVEFEAIIRYGICDVRNNQGRGKYTLFKRKLQQTHRRTVWHYFWKLCLARAHYRFASYSETKSKIKQDYTLPAFQAVEYTLQGILCMYRVFLPTGGPGKSSPLPSLCSSCDTGNYKAGKRRMITNFSTKTCNFCLLTKHFRGLNVFVSFRSNWNLEECCKTHFNW